MRSNAGRSGSASPWPTLFRVLALFVAGWLATNTWVRWLGALT